MTALATRHTLLIEQLRLHVEQNARAFEILESGRVDEARRELKANHEYLKGLIARAQQPEA